MKTWNPDKDSLTSLQSNPEESTSLLNINDIRFGSHGISTAYVVDGIVKRSKRGDYFVTLYLLDCNGNSIPGYLFTLTDWESAGLDVHKIKGHLVTIHWSENFIDGFGMTLSLTKVLLHRQESVEKIKSFVGSYDDAKDIVDSIFSYCSEVLGERVAPISKMSALSSKEYSNGKVGGIAKHADGVLACLKTLKDTMSEAEYKTLISTYLCFISTLVNYMVADSEGNADVTFVAAMNSKLSVLKDRLDLHDDILEITNYFFGVTPRGYYVRCVVSAHEMIMKLNKELTVWRGLPVKQKGDAGYGTMQKLF